MTPIDEKLDKHIDKLIDISDNIKIGKISILTGSNSSGKSLIRKIMIQSIAAQLNCEPKNGLVISTSQERRTTNNPNFGALSGSMLDDGWVATSTSTVRQINGVINQGQKCFVIIDEPEIGMGEELQLGLCEYLNEKFQTLTGGILIITHSKHIVKNLKHDLFFNIDGMTEEEWLNRIPKPKNIAEFEKEATDLFVAIRDRQNNKKEEAKTKNEKK